MTDNEVILIRLDSGEELIGDTTVSPDGYEVKNPLGIRSIVDTKTGRVTMEFFPIMAFANEGLVVFYPNHVQAIAYPEPDLIKHYHTTVNGTPALAVPDKKIILS